MRTGASPSERDGGCGLSTRPPADYRGGMLDGGTRFEVRCLHCPMRQSLDLIRERPQRGRRRCLAGLDLRAHLVSEGQVPIGYRD